ncbi:hypothetical protein CCR82_02105 [Halochromatium salexigens]|uniref:Uncharacterized protein n=2 Tax=Halochromatium salexigens TaxID=49447 RepID=A0AAJ0XF47_HALSE|nr:hypothetical protein [Halochromatium salexigens]
MTRALRTAVPPLIGLLGVLAGGVAQAETITGKINGHGCAHGGHTCPANKLDPHLAFEPTFVLQQPDGEYFFLSNLPRDVKVRHVLEEARATGTVDDKYNTMVVDAFMVKTADGFETVWTQQAHEDMHEYVYEDGWFQFSGEVQ